MSKITITVDEQVLNEARAKAAVEGTSVKALIRSFLERYVHDVETRKKALEDILAVSRTSRAAKGGRRWTRDELHERDT
jgi:hypothetical protein